MITASFTVTKEDALALAKYYYSTSPTVQSSLRWAHIAPPILFVFLAGLTLFHTPVDIAPPISLVIIIVIWLLLYPRFHNWYLIRTAEKMFSESAYQKTFGPCTIVLTEEGIHSTSATGEAKYTWAGVNRVHLTTSHLLIFLAGPQGFSIPRNQLPDSTIQEIKSFSEKMLQKAAPRSN